MLVKQCEILTAISYSALELSINTSLHRIARDETGSLVPGSERVTVSVGVSGESIAVITYSWWKSESERNTQVSECHK